LVGVAAWAWPGWSEWAWAAAWAAASATTAAAEWCDAGSDDGGTMALAFFSATFHAGLTPAPDDDEDDDDAAPDDAAAAAESCNRTCRFRTLSSLSKFFLLFLKQMTTQKIAISFQDLLL